MSWGLVPKGITCPGFHVCSHRNSRTLACQEEWGEGIERDRREAESCEWDSKKDKWFVRWCSVMKTKSVGAVPTSHTMPSPKHCFK